MIRGDSDAKALTITRDDYTAAELREAAIHSNDANSTTRMLALALVLEGYKRGEAGKLRGTDRRTLRDWVPRDNVEGVAGLGNRMAAEPKPRLAPQREAAVAELVCKGRDRAVEGMVRWRRGDLKRIASIATLPHEIGVRSFPNAAGMRLPS
jgi:transposase